MPEWSNFIKKNCIEPEDLPNPHGPNIVVIETMDTEEAKDFKTQQPYERHLLFLAGWRLPFRLNNTRIKIIRELFGDRVEDCLGKKIVLMVGMDNSFGEARPVINIHPFVPNQAAEPNPVPSRLSVTEKRRLEAASMYGVAITPPSFRIPGHSPSPSSPAVRSGNPAAKLGEENAAKLLITLRERGKDWDWMVAHLKRDGMGAMVDGKLPADCEAAIREVVWKTIKDLPKTVTIEDREGEIARLMASWRPPASLEKVDVKTGEVINPDDDIPF